MQKRLPWLMATLMAISACASGDEPLPATSTTTQVPSTTAAAGEKFCERAIPMVNDGLPTAGALTVLADQLLGSDEAARVADAVERFLMERNAATPATPGSPGGTYSTTEIASVVSDICDVVLEPQVIAVD